jgi:hypothetical protein
MGTNFYRKERAPLISFYNVTKPNHYEIDLRKELKEIIWDDKRGVYLLYRKCRFLNSLPEKCECNKGITLEPDIDTNCDVCKSYGYLFDDYIVRGYRSQTQAFSGYTGYQEMGKKINLFGLFYFEYDFISSKTGNNLDIPTTYDKIIEVEMDINGQIQSPLRQRIRYDILSADSYRLDNMGRIEYYRIRSKASVMGSYLL